LEHNLRVRGLPPMIGQISAAIANLHIIIIQKSLEILPFLC